AKARMRGQVGQNLKLSHQSSVRFHVEAALHWLVCFLRNFFLPDDDHIVRKAIEYLVLVWLKFLLPSGARRERRQHGSCRGITLRHDTPEDDGVVCCAMSSLRARWRTFFKPARRRSRWCGTSGGARGADNRKWQGASTWRCPTSEGRRPAICAGTEIPDGCNDRAVLKSRAAPPRPACLRCRCTRPRSRRAPCGRSPDACARSGAPRPASR